MRKTKTNSTISSFSLWYDALKLFIKKLGKTFKLQKEFLKTEMNHDEKDGENYKDKINECLPYVKNDVLCTAFSYASYTKAMKELTGFGMKDCLSLPGLGLKLFTSLRTEEDEPIYTYNDKYMRWFVRQAAYGSRVCAFNLDYKSKSCDNISKSISEELNVTGNVYDIIEENINYRNKHFKTFEKEYESHFNDHRNENVEEKEKFINEKLGDFPIHQLIRQLKINELLWDFDCISLYPSAIWDKNSIYSKIESGFAFTRDMIDELVKNFNIQTFTRGSAIFKIK